MVIAALGSKAISCWRSETLTSSLVFRYVSHLL